MKRLFLLGAATFVVVFVGLTLLLSPPARAQVVEAWDANMMAVDCGAASIYRVHGDAVMMTYKVNCEPAGAAYLNHFLLPLTVGFPVAFIGDTGGFFSRCAFGVTVDDLRYLADNPAFDPNLPDDPNNPMYLTCDPNVAPTVQFYIYSGVDPNSMNKVADLGAICDTVIDPNLTADYCERQDFTDRTYSRYVKLTWAHVADPNAPGLDPNCVFTQSKAKAWMTCSH